MKCETVVSFAPSPVSLLSFLCKQQGPVIYEVTLLDGKRIQFERERLFSTVREGADYIRQRFGWIWTNNAWILSAEQETEMQKVFDEQSASASSQE
jgi:hypothetical protein